MLIESSFSINYGSEIFGEIIKSKRTRRYKMKKVTPGQILGLATVLANNVDWTKVDGSVIQDLITDPSGTGKKGTEWLENIVNVQIVIDKHIVDLDADPFIPEGWSVEEHKKGGQFKYDPTEVELYLDEDQKNGKNIDGNKLRKNLANQNVFNVNLLDFLLENPQLIPESWKGKAIFFWGTVYRDADGYLFVSYLYCIGGDRWRWDHCRLDDSLDSFNPTAVRGK
jgi:hypothetical protein